MFPFVSFFDFPNKFHPVRIRIFLGRDCSGVEKIENVTVEGLFIAEDRNSRVTKSSYASDVTLWVTNSKIFAEILLSSY